MKRMFCISEIAVLMVTIVVVSIKPLTQLSSQLFWNFVSVQFDREEQERQRWSDEGNIVRGKDTALIWENMFEIWHQSGEKLLSIETKNLSKTILEKVNGYRVVADKLYVVSEEGYAVIDRNNLCRVYITVPEDRFVTGFSVDEQGNRHALSRFIESENIQYLSSFEAFSAKEQEVFHKLND